MISAELHFPLNVFLKKGDLLHELFGLVHMRHALLSYCGLLEEFSSNHSHLPIIAVIPGMLFIPLYLLVQPFSTVLLLRQRFINETSGDIT